MDEMVQVVVKESSFDVLLETARDYLGTHGDALLESRALPWASKIPKLIFSVSSNVWLSLRSTVPRDPGPYLP